MSQRHLRRLKRLQGHDELTELAATLKEQDEGSADEEAHEDAAVRDNQGDSGDEDDEDSRGDEDEQSDSTSDEDDEDDEPAATINAFAALMGDDDEDEEEDEEHRQEEEEQEQEAEEGEEGQNTSSPQEAGQPSAESRGQGTQGEGSSADKSKRRRRKRNKAKNKQKQQQDKQKSTAAQGGDKRSTSADKAGDQGEEEDLDAIIKSVQEQFGETGDGSATSSKPATSAQQQQRQGRPSSLLKVDRRFLNAEKELARRFRARTGTRAGRQHHQQQMRARGRVVRTAMVTAKPDWPPSGRMGITMTIVPGTSATSSGRTGGDGAVAEDDGTRFRFAHSPSYKEVQRQFLRAVKGFNPQAFARLLQRHPYHVDSLLQLSEVVRVNGDQQQASDFVERALYCFEASMHPVFNPSTGKCRMDYKYFENRAFFIALFKHISFINSRGCWRTALECCKYLLALDPDTDPVGALLLIDYYALRSRELSFFLSLCEQWGERKKLHWLPNFAFSHAMAEYMLSQQQDLTADRRQRHADAADALLQRALMRFPEALNLLAERNGANLRRDVTRHTLFTKELSPNRSEKNVRVLLLLFVERNYTLWEPAETMVWLQNNAAAVIEKMQSDTDVKREVEEYAEWRKQQFPRMPLNIQRHVLMSKIETAAALLPPSVLHRATFDHDPLPPPNGINEYEREEEEEARRRRNRDGGGAGNADLGALQAFVASFNPNFNAEQTREQQEQHERARQEVRARVMDTFARAREGVMSVAQNLTRLIQRQEQQQQQQQEEGGGQEAGEAPVDVDPEFFEGVDQDELDALLGRGQGQGDGRRDRR